MLFREIPKKREEVEEVESYYDDKAQSYEEQFNMLYFKIFDAITWKYIEPYIPKDTDALLLDAHALYSNSFDFNYHLVVVWATCEKLVFIFFPWKRAAKL